MNEHNKSRNTEALEPQSVNMATRAVLEALAVDDRWSRLIVFGLGDPHVLERGQRGQNRASNPDRVLAFRWRDDLDFHRRWS